MRNKRYYVAQYVVGFEDQWFAPDTDGPPVRVERSYRVLAELFTAQDAEAAYQLAAHRLGGYSDSSHDGPGDLRLEFPVGIYQVEDVTPIDDDILAATDHEIYGLDVGGFDTNDMNAAGVPLIRTKSELDIFKNRRQG